MIRLTFWLASANSAQLVLAFAQSIVMARWLGLERSGHLGYFLSLVTLADTLAQGGLERIVVRDAAANPKRDGALLAAALRARLALAAVTALALAPFAGRWAALLLLATLGQTATAVLQARRLRGAQVAAGLGGAAVTFAAVAACAAWMAPSVRAAMAALALAGLARAALQLGLAWAHLKRPAPLAAGGSAALLRESWPLWINALAVSAYYRLDVILLRALLPPDDAVAQIGWYRIAYSLTEGGGVVLGALATSAFPIFASLHAAPRGELARVFGRAVKYAALLGGGAVVATWVLGGLAVRLMYLGRPEFWPGADALPWLAPVLLLGLLNSLHALLLTAAHRTRAVLAISLAQLAFNAVANVLVIPAYGFRGAAAVTSCTEAVGLVLFAWQARAVLIRSRS